MEINITTKQATFFVATLSVVRTQEDNTEKRVKEQYAIDAQSFTEAEKKVYEQITGFELELKDLTIAPYKEAFLSAGDRFYRVKVNMITFDERTGKEKKSPVCYLVQASSTAEAQRIADKVLGSTMLDYTTESVIETKIIEIISE